MAQAGATLITRGRKPGERETIDQRRRYKSFRQFKLRFRKALWVNYPTTKHVPANNPLTPCSATILLITLKVEEETLPVTDGTRTSVNIKRPTSSIFNSLNLWKCLFIKLNEKQLSPIITILCLQLSNLHLPSRFDNIKR